ncbi:hypothetical protein IFM89_016927 [Coptis chinensis]|uniref:RNase H type-1 domain-containing protein n=1 Tax=Coptis chinensis TaxID=261450 RepID=A0A835HV99_9MAGN|nr:hypothetical protein IFM89_016927 [Coptis chinensis]
MPCDNFVNEQLEFIESSVVDDIVQVPDDVIVEGIEQWSEYLVGYFVDKRMPFHLVKRTLGRAWKTKADYVISTTKDFFSTSKLLAHDDHQIILDGGPVFVVGRIFIPKCPFLTPRTAPRNAHVIINTTTAVTNVALPNSIGDLAAPLTVTTPRENVVTAPRVNTTLHRVSGANALTSWQPVGTQSRTNLVQSSTQGVDLVSTNSFAALADVDENTLGVPCPQVALLTIVERGNSMAQHPVHYGMERSNIIQSESAIVLYDERNALVTDVMIPQVMAPISEISPVANLSDIVMSAQPNELVSMLAEEVTAKDQYVVNQEGFLIVEEQSLSKALENAVTNPLPEFFDDHLEEMEGARYSSKNIPSSTKVTTRQGSKQNASSNSSPTASGNFIIQGTINSSTSKSARDAMLTFTIWLKRGNAGTRSGPSLMQEGLLANVKVNQDAQVLLESLGIVTTFRNRPLQECIWTKPLGDVVKLNIDGSLSDSRTGSGRTIHDCFGEVLLAFTSSGGMKSVIFQEMKAIYEGLRGCEMLQKSKIIVASDFMRAIHILLGK